MSNHIRHLSLNDDHQSLQIDPDEVMRGEWTAEGPAPAVRAALSAALRAMQKAQVGTCIWPVLSAGGVVRWSLCERWSFCERLRF